MARSIITASIAALAFAASSFAQDEAEGEAAELCDFEQIVACLPANGDLDAFQLAGDELCASGADAPIALAVVPLAMHTSAVELGMGSSSETYFDTGLRNRDLRFLIGEDRYVLVRADADASQDGVRAAGLMVHRGDEAGTVEIWRGACSQGETEPDFMTRYQDALNANAD